MTRSARWRDVLLTALAPAIWGSTYLVTSHGLPPGLPLTAAVLRVLPAGLLLLAWTRSLPRAADRWRLLVLAVLNIGVFQALLFVAAYRLPGGLAAVLGAIQPLLVLLLAWVVDHRRPAAAAVIASASGVAGMAILLVSPQTVWEPVGIAAALVGAACMAAGTWLAHRWRLDMPVLASTGWQLLLGGALLLPAVWLSGERLPVLTLSQLGAYAYLSLAGALLAYALWFRGVARLPPVAVASLGLLSPLTAVLLGWSVLGQAMTGTALAGLALVLGSVLAVQWLARPRSSRPQGDAGLGSHRIAG
ncbi:EamA family transporter [Xanthomonas sp. XNM01]|uniref:EamA family transporter n=1 Tax=Xanthomonas sp. XNM01 TaxID=2769289 RepID=UPI00177FF956|nr:EamA family transporter [Xanthomonas sp. XNM01]MBD9367497.1 EamA family transporter [Xanthomonas sp. XNM01]